MIAFKCDRCGEFTPTAHDYRKEKLSVHRKVKDTDNLAPAVELCTKCTNELAHWLDNYSPPPQVAK